MYVCVWCRSYRVEIHAADVGGSIAVAALVIFEPLASVCWNLAMPLHIYAKEFFKDWSSTKHVIDILFACGELWGAVHVGKIVFRRGVLTTLLILSMMMVGSLDSETFMVIWKQSTHVTCTHAFVVWPGAGIRTQLDWLEQRHYLELFSDVWLFQACVLGKVDVRWAYSFLPLAQRPCCNT